ncbi:MAG TPA: DNA polymerase III subunit epsilon [Sedimenticola sp.]|nr:DNA polymerase III subunit epsilon [Sedimenticola sp.]
MRQIVLDTETTGLEPEQGHRIIEIGCVELIDRRPSGNNFHQYLQPDREIDDGAVEVHGITTEFLADKPRFGDIVEDFIGYLNGAELIIHNAPFDVGFINAELRRLDPQSQPLEALCPITDTLAMARKLHPGQRNSLDALCKRYEIDNTQRQLHGALLDSEILADVYLAMTGGQVALSLGGPAAGEETGGDAVVIRRLDSDRSPLTVIRASKAEREAHEARLDALDEACGGSCVWRR